MRLYHRWDRSMSLVRTVPVVSEGATVSVTNGKTGVRSTRDS